MKKRTPFLASIICIATLLILPLRAWAADDVGGTISCWSCNTVIYGMKIIDSFYSVPDELGHALWPLFAAIVLASIVWSTLKALAVGINPLMPIIKTIQPFAFASVIFITPGALSTITWTMTTVPIIELGSGIGYDLGNAAKTVITQNLPETECESIDPKSLNITSTAILAATQTLVSNTCQVHQAIATTFRIGSIIASQNLAEGSTYYKMVSKTFNSIGIFIVFTSYVALLDYAVTIFEILVRICLYALFAPFLLIFSIFESTRSALSNALSIGMNLFLCLVANGLVSALILYILLMSMTLGIDPNATGPESPTAIITSLNDTLSQGTSITAATNMARAIRLAALTAIGASMSLAISQSMRNTIQELTQSPTGADGNRTMANAVIGAAGKMLNSVQGLGAAGLGSLGSSLGRGLGNMLKFK